MSRPERDRVGLFGGSFDPPHLGHLQLARAARDQLGLERVLWLPAGAPWQKSNRAIAPGQHRAAMLRLLIGAEAGFSVDERELQRPGPTYTIDTVGELDALSPGCDWVLLIGQDQYFRFHTWHRWPELLERVSLGVVARAGQAVRASDELAQRAHRMSVIDMPRLDVAATAVRACMDAGLDITELVGPAVAGYIDQNSLYRAPHRS